MMTEEQLVTTRLSRRQFMGATAAATFAAFVEGREPRLHAAVRTQGNRRCGDRAVDGRGHGADRDVRSEALHAVRAGRAGRAGPEHVPDHRHRGRQHQVHAGPRADRQRDRSRRGDPHVQRRGPRVHPALTPPISLAHRLHPAAADGDAAPRRGRSRGRSGPKNPDMPAFIAIGQTVEGGGRDRHAQGVPHRGLSRHRARAVPDRRSAGRGVGRPAAEGARRGAVPQPPAAVREAARRRSRSYQYGSDFQRESLVQVARRRRPAAAARRRRRRSISRSSRRRASTPTTPAGSARAACSRGG